MSKSSPETADASADSTPPAMTPEELAAVTKLGILLVNTGAADEAKVFGSAGSAVMKAYRSGVISDLVVVNRAEDDAARHPFAWYKPWTWFTSGAQVSPMQWRTGPTIAAAATTAQPSQSAGVDASIAVATQTAESGLLSSDLGSEEAGAAAVGLRRA